MISHNVLVIHIIVNWHHTMLLLLHIIVNWYIMMSLCVRSGQIRSVTCYRYHVNLYEPVSWSDFRRLNCLPHQVAWWGGCMIWTPSTNKNKTCQRAEELLVSQRPSIIWCPTVPADVVLQWATFPRRLVAGFALWPTYNASLCKNTRSGV